MTAASNDSAKNAAPSAGAAEGEGKYPVLEGAREAR